MPPDEEEEFWEWFENLPPEDQEQFLYQTEFGASNEVPYSFGGAMSPSLDQGSYDLTSFGGGAQIPELTAKGKVDPYDLSQEAKRFNLIQDYATGSVDNALAMYAGPGAYGPGAFEEQVTMPTQRANDSGSRMLQSYAQGGGYEGYMAQKIMDGATPSQAFAELMDFIETEPDESTPPEAVAQQEALRASLPKVVRDGPVPPGEEEAPIDTDRVLSFGTDIFESTFQDDQPLWTDPETGIGYMDEPQMQQSDAAQWYADRGLPSPVDSYADEEYTQRFMQAADPNIAQNEQMRAQSLGQANQRQDQALQASREADTSYRAQEDALQEYLAQFSPAGFSTRPGQGFRDMARSESPGISALGGEGARARQPTFDRSDPEVVQRQMADAALTNLGSTYRPEGFRPEYDGDQAEEAAFVDEQGRVSASLGTKQRNPDAPFDFAVALGGRNKRPVSRSSVTQARSGRDSKRREFQRANTERFQQERVRATPEQQDVAYSLGMAAGLARTGRTPLQDALMQRVLGQRAMGARGG